jgi:aspartate/methionine/tyrosine aminotransferase
MNELKAGWVIGEEDIIKRINGIIDLVTPLVLNLDLGYAAILIRNREWIRKRNMDIIMPNAKTLRDLSKTLGNKARVYYSDYMPITYIEINCRELTGMVLAEELLTKDVLIVPGKYFGKDNGIRIGLGSVRPEAFETAMKIIINVINNECRDKQNNAYT